MESQWYKIELKKNKEKQKLTNTYLMPAHTKGEEEKEHRLVPIKGSSSLRSHSKNN